MFGFVVLIVLLILAVLLFSIYPIFKRTILYNSYNDVCKAKVKRLALRRNLNVLDDIVIENHEHKKVVLSHILFGKKYIYLISDYCYIGVINGMMEDNSWIYYDRREKRNYYVDNLVNKLSGNIQDFAEILRVGADSLIPIAIIPNECELNVEETNKHDLFIVHYSSFSKLIRKLEKRNIGSFNVDQLKERFEGFKLKYENKKRK